MALFQSSSGCLSCWCRSSRLLSLCHETCTAEPGVAGWTSQGGGDTSDGDLSLSGSAYQSVLCGCCYGDSVRGPDSKHFTNWSAELSRKVQRGRWSWADSVMNNVSLTSEYVNIILLAEMHQQKCKHKQSLVLLQVFFSFYGSLEVL